MPKNISFLGANYQNVPAVELPQTGGGTATFTDVTDTTATQTDVLTGKYFYLANGTKVQGTATGGSSAISVVDTEDSHGGTIRTITAIDISDTTAVAEDVAQGKYFYTADGTKTMGVATGGGAAGLVWQDGSGYVHLSNEEKGDAEVTISSNGAVSQELLPDTVYHFTSSSLTSLTITLAGSTNEQYHFDFISPSTAATLNLPASVTMETPFSVEANTKYEIDIYQGYGVFAEWAVQ